MASSGSASVSVTSYDTMKISWTVNSQSTSNNTSNITFKAVLTSDSNGKISSTASKSYSATINGTTYSGTNTVGISANSSLTLFTKTLDIAHDSDGSKSFTFSYTQTFDITFSGSSIGSKSVSCTVNPTTIARASSITSASNVTLGNACSVKWTPASSSFAYKIKFEAGGYSYTTGTISPGTTSAYTYTGYTFAIATWAPYITSATTATCTATLYTYSSSSSSSSIGTATKTFTLTVPSSCAPTASMSIAEANSDVSASSISVYLNGKSKLKISVTATMSYSSAISSIAVTVGSTSYSPSVTATSSGATATVTSGTISSSSVTVKVTVTDKRGRTGTASTTVSLSTYSNPSIDTFSVTRCDSSGTADDSGECVKVVYKYTVTNVSGNSSSALVQYKKATASSYGTTLISESGTWSKASTTYISSAVFSTESGYDFQFSLNDALVSVSKTARIATSAVVMDFLSDGTGMAIGKVAETSGLFDIAWKTKITSAANQLSIANSGTSGATGVWVTSWSGKNIGLVVGHGGDNRGVYDYTRDGWLINADADNQTWLAYPNGSFKPYWAAGDSFSSSYFSTAGFVTSSGTSVRFTIPLNRPVCGSPTVTVTGTFVLRQNGNYTHGSASGAGVAPSQIQAGYRGSSYINVFLTMADTTNCINNDTIGIYSTDLKVTFS